MNYVKDTINARKMIDMDRQAMDVADKLQRILNKAGLSAPVACMAIFEVYSRTEAFYPEIMKMCRERLLKPTNVEEKDGKQG